MGVAIDDQSVPPAAIEYVVQWPSQSASPLPAHPGLISSTRFRCIKRILLYCGTVMSRIEVCALDMSVLLCKLLLFC